ncbi:MAG: serine/threonine protein phosphatase [Pseudomonadota bacterium]
MLKPICSLLAILWLAAQAPALANTLFDERGFTLAVIPDTQNYLDYTRQREAGFAIDSVELFLAQMRYIAENSAPRGGDIAFVTSVGDVWQHQTQDMDAAHAERGFKRISNPYLEAGLKISDKALTFEIPRAIEGYGYLATAGVPFGVAPGNHDYDAMWSAAGFPPNLDKERGELTMTAADLGVLHIGGLDNFRSAFGEASDFFRDKAWYVASHRGGASSAQRFDAAGYTFLHIALEMSPDDAVLAWAESVMLDYPGMPTIVTTHDYLSPRGELSAVEIVDLALVDPDYHNSAQQLWDKFLSQHDQIFLVLCGHQHGQAWRVDNNRSGHAVYQILADYQDRGQAGLDAGQPRSGFRNRPAGIGDGWFRLMRFDFSGANARVHVQTYSSHYASYSGDMPEYPAWYRDHEQPGMSDTDFYAADDYVLELTDFFDRFGQDDPP